jgi:two-component system, cell cycle sensor histidine kinase and response regulator CckA
MPGSKIRPKLRAISNLPRTKKVGTTFWVDNGGSLIEYDSIEMVEAFETGQLHGDTQVRISKDAPNKPLRKYIREMVWLAYESTESKESVSKESTSFGSALFEVAFQRAPIGIVLSDLAGRIEHVNEAFCRLVGYTRDELIGMAVGAISEADSREEEIRLGNEVISGKRDAFQIEKRFIAKDGEPIDTLLNVAVVHSTGQKPVNVIAHIVDLTNRKVMERELAQTARLQTVGQLASGVAHDFNNLLTIILGLLPSITDAEVEDRDDAIQQMTEAAQAGARLTRQLMTFSRQGVVDVEIVEVNGHIEKLRTILRAATGAGAKLKLELDSFGGHIRIDAVQLEQVIMNLSFNAVNAMPHGGTLTIRTSHSNGQVVVDIEDTGVGMSEEICARAFEPFFTDRQDGKGIGLGLSTVHGIVTRFGGEIAIKSQVGQGTQCRVLFPKVSAGDVVSKAKSNPKIQKHSKMALVVDDQPIILKIVSRILKNAGYDVLAGDSVAEGKTHVASMEKPFDIVVTDVQLADGDGGEIATAVRNRWSSVPILFMSGYTADVLSQWDVNVGEANLIQKPFVPGDLLKRVDELTALPRSD